MVREQQEQEKSDRLELGLHPEFERLPVEKIRLDLVPPRDKFTTRECLDDEGNPQPVEFYNNALTYPLPLESSVEIEDRFHLGPLRDKSHAVATRFFSAEKNIREYHSLYGVESTLVALARKLNLKDEEIMTLSSIGLLHDIGRVVMDKERVLGKFRGINGRQFTIVNSREHPQISARYLETENVFDDPAYTWGEQIPDDVRMNIKKIIFNAVLFHGDKELPPDYPGIEALKLLKDADKIENLYQMSHILKSGTFFDDKIAGSFVGRLTQDKTITPAVRQQFLNGELVDVSSMETRLDNLIGYLAWYRDFHHPESQQLAIDSGYAKNLFPFLRKHIDVKQIEQYQESFDSLTSKRL